MHDGLTLEQRAIAEESRHAFGFISFDELQAGGIKPIDWLVRGYLEADALAVIFGDPACGKTFVALDLACCIASGKDWHGRDVRQGAVFYIAGEGRNGIHRRLAAWEIRNATGRLGDQLFVSTRAAQLCNMAHAASVAEAVDEIAEQSNLAPRLIVVDTLARNFGGNENDAEDMGAFVSNLDGFLRHKYQATVLVIHHSGKADKTSGRGSSALRAAVDAEYQVERSDRTVQLSSTKMKDAPEPEPMAFVMRVVDLPVNDEEGNPETSVVLDVTDALTLPSRASKGGAGRNQRQALDVLKNLLAKHAKRRTDAGHPAEGARVTASDWRDGLAAAGIDRRRAGEVMRSLVDAGRVRKDFGDFVSLVDEDASPW